MVHWYYIGTSSSSAWLFVPFGTPYILTTSSPTGTGWRWSWKEWGVVTGLNSHHTWMSSCGGRGTGRIASIFLTTSTPQLLGGSQCRQVEQSVLAMVHFSTINSQTDSKEKIFFFHRRMTSDPQGIQILARELYTPERPHIIVDPTWSTVSCVQ